MGIDIGDKKHSKIEKDEDESRWINLALTDAERSSVVTQKPSLGPPSRPESGAFVIRVWHVRSPSGFPSPQYGHTDMWYTVGTNVPQNLFLSAAENEQHPTTTHFTSFAASDIAIQPSP